jgi:hypothetical protein
MVGCKKGRYNSSQLVLIDFFGGDNLHKGTRDGRMVAGALTNVTWQE